MSIKKAGAMVFDYQLERILLILDRRSGKWGPPKGHLNPDEDPLQGALRELAEETGIKFIEELSRTGHPQQSTSAIPIAVMNTGHERLVLDISDGHVTAATKDDSALSVPGPASHNDNAPTSTRAELVFPYLDVQKIRLYLLVISDQVPLQTQDPEEIQDLRWWPLTDLPPENQSNKVLKVMSKKISFCLQRLRSFFPQLTTRSEESRCSKQALNDLFVTVGTGSGSTNAGVPARHIHEQQQHDREIGTTPSLINVYQRQRQSRLKMPTPPLILPPPRSQYRILQRGEKL